LNRRGVLSVAVGLLAPGCSSPFEDPQLSERTLSDVGVSGLDDVPVSITTTVTQPSITAEETARFELTVGGKRDAPVGVLFGNEIPFDPPERSDRGTPRVSGRRQRRAPRRTKLAAC